MLKTDGRILRLTELCQRLGLCRTSIHHLIRTAGFPRQLKLTPHASGWRLSAVERWLAERERLLGSGRPGDRS